jgi:SAM-dependent methyltransferase
MTTKLSAQNRKAWETQAYEAWVNQYGAPQDYAAELKATFVHKIRHIAPHLGNLTGMKIANPLGSNGRLAVALALAGADMTVFDISKPNRRYALELAEAAGVELVYIVGDFGSLDLSAHRNTFGAAVIDHGVLHYFTDLDGFVAQVAGLLRNDGKLIIHEFHPLLKKAVSLENGTAQLTGDYFSSDIETVPVAFAPFTDAPDTQLPCLVRRWTLGEIVTAFASGGFVIEALLELPETSFPTLPGSCVLVAHHT